jgi:hypothetical protein
MKQNLKIIILTQEDSVAIPNNITKINRLEGVTIDLVCVIDSKGSVVNKKSLFIKGFGYMQAVKMAWKLASIRLSGLCDRLFNGPQNCVPRSIQSAARQCGADFRVLSNPNSPSFLEEIAAREPSLIVSFSAPVVFKEKLLSLPKLGCINLHCSPLPRYAGLLPSFWVLFNLEKETGVSVHYMDTEIDNGRILGQRTVSIDPGETIFSLVEKTKGIGGELVASTVEKIRDGVAEERENSQNERTYFGWPSLEQIRTFSRNGGRLV